MITGSDGDIGNIGLIALGTAAPKLGRKMVMRDVEANMTKNLYSIMLDLDITSNLWINPECRQWFLVSETFLSHIVAPPYQKATCAGGTSPDSAHTPEINPLRSER